MNTESTDPPNKPENEELSAVVVQPKREVYPEVNDRLKGVVIWLGLGFVIMVFLIQHFSGYS